MQFNLFESKIQQHQINDLQNQYNENNAQKIQINNQQKQLQLQQLAQRYQIEQALPTDTIGGAEREEMIITLMPKKLVARLVIFSNFPEAKPRIYMQSKYTHTFIDQNTWEIIYTSFYLWKEQSSNLLELITAIANRFSNSFPTQDPLLSEMNNIKNQCCEQSEYAKLFSGDLSKYYPNHRPEQWQGLCSYNLDEFIMKTQEYKGLVQYVLELMQANEIFSQTMITKYNEILSRRSQIEQLAQLCDIKKGKLLQNYQNCHLIKERFDKSNILAFLEQELTNLMEISENMENKNLDQYDNSQLDIQAQINAYQTYRKQYHTLKLKKQKLEEII